MESHKPQVPSCNYMQFGHAKHTLTWTNYALPLLLHQDFYIIFLYWIDDKLCNKISQLINHDRNKDVLKMRSILHNHLLQVSYLSVVPNHVLLTATHLKPLTNLQIYQGLMWSLFLIGHLYLSGIAPVGRLFIGNVNNIHGWLWNETPLHTRNV